MKKIQFFYFLFVVLAACKNEGNKDRNYKIEMRENKHVYAKKESGKPSIDSVIETAPPDERQQNSIEILDADLMLFNGKVKRFFSLKDFKKNFGEADSTKRMKHKERCAYVFQNIDPTQNLQDKFLYKDGSRFENSKEKVAIDEFRFTKNNFILYKGITFNSSTTIAQLQKIFPNAVENMSIMSVYGEGELQMFQLREGIMNFTMGTSIFFLKTADCFLCNGGFPVN
jgi:hypothetical protein